MPRESRPKPDGWEGFTTGLTYWLLFMLAFTALGYSPFLSITFGAIGGIASAVITDWVKGGAIKVNVLPSAADAPAKASPKKRTRPFQQRQSIGRLGRRKRRHRQTRSQRRFSWLFRKS
jgi:hypothetical protein